MKVLSRNGWNDFDGVLETKDREILEIVFENSPSLRCTPCHRILTNEGWKHAEDLFPMDKLECGKIVLDVIYLNEKKDVYDLINVQNGHEYLTNGITSHNCLYLDEFAFVDNDGEFYTSTYPVVTSGKTTKVIITSTANGISNYFYKIWQGAVTGVNEYVPSRIDWWDVPGRDEKWKEQTIANTSKEQFDQEFGNLFIGGGNTLIDADKLLQLKSRTPVLVQGETKIYERPKEDHVYVCTVDTAKGRGQDYSTFSVIDITVSPFRQVATYRNNLISPLTFPDVVYKIAKAYNDAYLIVESNDQGSMVYKTLYYEYEYENMFSGKLSQGVSFGLEMTKTIKRLGCSNLKDIVEQGKIEIFDDETIKELCSFEHSGNSYAAASGAHDDMVMTLVMFAWFLNTNMFGYMSDDNLRQLMAEEKEKLLLESVPFEGVFHAPEIDESIQYLQDIHDQNLERRRERFAFDPDFGLIVIDEHPQAFF